MCVTVTHIDGLVLARELAATALLARANASTTTALTRTCQQASYFQASPSSVHGCFDRSNLGRPSTL